MQWDIRSPYIFKLLYDLKILLGEVYFVKIVQII